MQTVAEFFTIVKVFAVQVVAPVAAMVGLFLARIGIPVLVLVGLGSLVERAYKHDKQG